MTTAKKKSGKDAKLAWMKADRKQKLIWRFKNKTKAAEVRGESAEFIAALQTELAEKLADLE
jgi:hypothetical protein